MSHISAVDGIVSIERAQADLPRLLDEIAGSREAIVIVRGGRAVGVLISPEEFDSLHEDPESLAAVDEALATIGTEELIEGEVMDRWLRSVGTPNELTPPE